jgi:hypothetical protein
MNQPPKPNIMKFAILILATLPYFVHAQPKIEKLVIGAGGHSIEQSFHTNGELWQISAMDPGTRIEVVKGSLYFTVMGMEGGLIVVGGACGKDGPATAATAVNVLVTPPVNLMSWSILSADCEPGKYITINRLQKP